MFHHVSVEMTNGDRLGYTVEAPGEVMACVTAYNAWSRRPDIERVHYIRPAHPDNYRYYIG